MRKRLMKKLGLPWLHKHNVLQNTLRLKSKKAYIYCYDHNSLRINTIPCSSDGSSPTISPVQITTSLEKDYYPSIVEMSNMFDDKLKRMKNDSFWTYS